MVLRALLIGINYYDTTSELNGCITDIEDIRKYLQSIGCRKFAMLHDRRNDPKWEYSQAPTRKRILEYMEMAISKTKAGDTLYVHYSGHGSSVGDKNSDEKDGKDETICPLDRKTAGKILDDEIYKVLVKKLATGAKLRVVFDSCYSGSCLDLPCRWGVENKYYTENSNKCDKDVIMISGCMDNQTSADASFGGRPNGAMTWSLLNAFAEIKATGQNASTYRWKDLVSIMRLKLQQKGYSQIPQVSAGTKERITQVVDLV